MIKIENTNVYGWDAAIRGMRNPMNSWDKSDSGIKPIQFGFTNDIKLEYVIGKNDLSLMQQLAKAGSDHRKYLRMINITMDINAPLYWWKEFDTYKVGTVANSCSTMHKIHEKEFTIEDFSVEHLMDNEAFTYPLGGGWRGLDAIELFNSNIEALNNARDRYLKIKDKKYWWQMIQLLPSSYNQRRTVQLNYEVLYNMYNARRNHKLDEWHILCDTMLKLPYFKEIFDIKEN